MRRGGGETNDASAALAGAEKVNPSVPKMNACTNPPASGDAPCSTLSSSLGSNGTEAHLEETKLIGGGLLVAVGVIRTLWPAGPEGPPMTQLAPITGPHVAGLQWKGSFWR